MPMIGIAITVPAPHGPLLQRHRDNYGDPMAAFIPTHVTLLPPTAVDEEGYAALATHLQEVADASAPFTMSLRGTGTFRPVSPVVFVQVAKGIGECEALELEVRRGPVERALDFPYHPHVTVAHHLSDEVMDQAFEELSGFAADFEVVAIDLYVHGQDGMWRARQAFELGGGSQ